jgi:PAB-dependent poly(A)-specific ribonuclease subunit 2
MEDQWHLFNDFLVHPSSKDDALRFDTTWKTPSVLAYQLKSAGHCIDEDWKENMDTSLLYESIPVTVSENPHQLTVLKHAEAPKPGTHVGIDAEFVSLQSEEIEIKADGTRETVRPSRLGLARVSVLRGDGPQEDLPFIDDYIQITEPVVDYLTAFSGIRPGDLDPNRSSHTLVTLKKAYKKLWLLLNLGCVFVGHGLLKDFRTINMHVPRGQVIDTVDLWFIKARARKLNLRFLSWLLLREDIQSGESHDSVEDARSALRLWRKYIEVQSQGKTEETLEWVYKRGREVGFRAPGAVLAGYKASGVGTAMEIGTPGRATPEPQLQPPGGSGEDEGRYLMGTPGRKSAFGVERVGFGSPLR